MVVSRLKILFLVFLLPLFTFAGIESNAETEIHPTLHNIKKIALLIADSKGMGQSSFGHVYFRLSKDSFWNDNDVTAEFVADNKGEPIQYSKGLGLTKNKYNYALHFGRYGSVRYNSNNIEDRTLTTYPLILSQEQVQEVLVMLTQLSQEIQKQQYSFLTKNCAYQVTQVLDKAFKKDPSLGFHIPVLLDNKYSQYIDHNGIVTDQAASLQRARLVQEQLPQSIKDSQLDVLVNIETQLLSSLFTDRLLAIFKLIKIQQFDSSLKMPRLFLSLYLLLENRAFYADVLEVMNSNHEKRIRLIPLNKDLSKLQVQGSIAVNPNTKNSIQLNDQPEADLIYMQRVSQGKNQSIYTQGRLQLPLMIYGFSGQNGRILFEDHVVGFDFQSEIYGSKKMAKNMMIMTEALQKNGQNYILPYILIELSDENHLDFNNHIDLKREEILSVVNFSGGGFGQCISLVLLQKAVMEQVVFAPNSAKLSAEANLDLLRRVKDGYFVIVPGYKNVWEWTESIGKIQVQEVVAETGRSANNIKKLIGQYFSRIKLNPANIQDLDISLSYGIPVPVRFQVNREKDARVEHALLVYEIVDKGDYYSLGVYDPNLGEISAHSELNPHRLSKKTGLYSSGLYARKETPLFADVMDLQRAMTFKQQQSRPDLEAFVKNSEKTGMFYYQLGSIANSK